MSSIHIVEWAPAPPVEGMPQMNWYAVRTRSRHEKLVDRQLQDQGITSFLPLVNQLQRWSDRQKLVQLPLFSGYAFVRIAPLPEDRVRVLRAQGVVSFVGTRGQGVAIPDAQIESLKVLLAAKVPFVTSSFLKVGQRVRIRGGSLDGMEGILASQNNGRSLVVSVDPIQRSLTIELQGYDVEPI